MTSFSRMCDVSPSALATGELPSYLLSWLLSSTGRGFPQQEEALKMAFIENHLTAQESSNGQHCIIEVIPPISVAWYKVS